MAELTDWFIRDSREDAKVQQVDRLTEEAMQREADAEQARIKENTTASDLIGSAAAQGTIGYIARTYGESKIAANPAYRLPENFQKIMEERGIDQSQWELFERATSQEHFDFLYNIALENQVADSERAQFGVLANMGADLLDPGMFAAGVATGGLANSARAGRVLNGLRAGVVASGEGYAMAEAQSQFNPNITTEDKLKNAAYGFMFGAAFGARTGAEYDALAKIPKIAKGELDDTLSAARTQGVAPDLTPGLKPLRADNEVSTRLEAEAAQNADRKAAFLGVRFDLSAQMQKMKSAVARIAGAKWFREGVGWTDRDAVVEESVTEFARRHAHDAEARFRYATNTAEQAWRKRNGISWYQLSERAGFRDEVTRAIRGDLDVSPEAKQAATGVSEVFARLGKLAKESGVEGFENFVPNANYVPRMFSKRGFARVFGELQLDEDSVIKNLIAPSIKTAWIKQAAREAGSEAVDTIDDKLVDAVSRAWLKRAQAKFEGDSVELLVKPLGGDDLDSIRELLKDGGIDNDTIDNLLFNLVERESDTSIARARKRIDMDETYTARVLKEDGTEVELRMSDLLENDSEKLVNAYSREISGWSAMATKFGVRNRKELAQLRRSILDDARKSGDDLDSLKRYLEIAERSTFGRTTEAGDSASSAFSKSMRVLRDYNFARVMNQVGFSLFAELGPLVAYSGLRNTLRSIPIAKDFLKRGADGKLSNTEARVIEELIPAGSDMARNPPFFRDPEEGDVLSGYFGRKFDNLTQGAKYTTSILSGMGPINSALQRVAARATLMRMMELAKASKLSAAEVRRLRAWGLSEQAQTKVFEVLRTAGKIDKIDPSKLDFTTREQMSAFLSRATRHQIVEGDPGDSLLLMHNAAGKTLMQFRTFMVNSYTRHFLYAANNLDDWRTHAMISLSTGFAALGWTARQSLNAVGDEEKQAKLQATLQDAYDSVTELDGAKALDNDLFKAAVQQSSWSTVGPMLVDTMAEATRNDPVFGNNSRGSGLATGVMGIPTVDLINKIYGGQGTVLDAVRTDKTVTQKEARDLWSTMLFNNMTGVRNISDAIIREFPKTDEDSSR